ncbi:MAG: hypothetical protein GXP58_08965 [Deltaproteobacteria bacterium]|nr:hypothetical protein [Deltaproteobacteria bacterium]
MTDEEKGLLEKLDHLLHHWMEHNESHGEGYKTWMNRAEQSGRADVAREIGKALTLSREMNAHFKKARKLLKGDHHV